MAGPDDKTPENDAILEAELNLLSMEEKTRILMGVPDPSQLNLSQFRALRDMANDSVATKGMSNLVANEARAGDKGRVQTPADAMPAPSTEIKR